MPIPLYTIVKYPSEILSKPTKTVINFGKPLEKIIRRLITTMRGADGVGLAANQVGLPIALAVIEYHPYRSKKKEIQKDEVPLAILINPKIIGLSDEQNESSEGCLSCPGIELKINRSTKIKIAAQTETGKSYQKTISGFAARIYQHEIDHLNGILILDRAQSQKALVEAYRAKPESFI